jgi:hypothetical protein
VYGTAILTAIGTPQFVLLFSIGMLFNLERNQWYLGKGMGEVASTFNTLTRDNGPTV